ncbi:MAG: proton-conducting transporter membrane subunit [bacterium]
MTFLLAAMAAPLLGGLLALFAGRSPRISTGLAVGGVLAACALGLPAALAVLGGGAPISLHAAWDVPYGSFFVELDALSAFFVLVVLVVAALAAVYGAGYLGSGHHARSLGPPWFFFGLLVASMLLVVTARNGVLFLVAWEVMALASFFLVVYEDEEDGVMQAGWTYLVATHLGTAFLLAFFALAGRDAGSLDFDRLQVASRSPALLGVLFVLGLVGFGTKAGLVPFHVWLPEAHPAAPSHVSALMSGAMIKLGIYGLLRMFVVLGPPGAAMAWTLASVGLFSAVLGALFALAQQDLKRLLAYSSIENMGIVCLGLGVGFLGRAAGAPAVAVLGFAGALLHVANHALMKSLLFLGAGSIVRAAGTRSLDRLGGLLKRMPRTGTAFLVGAVAICGLPPLNGFVSELLIFLGSLRGGTMLPMPGSLRALAVAAGLALTAGLAAVGFAKAAGIALLGEPRSKAAGDALEVGAAMSAPVVVLAAACFAAALASPLLVTALAPVVSQVGGFAADSLPDGLAIARRALHGTLVAMGALAALAVVLVALRGLLLRKREVGAAVTWDCGFAAPSARMQYTASSFTEPVGRLFDVALRTRKQVVAPAGLFPARASLATETPDAVSAYAFAPAFRWLGVALSKLRWIQHGRLNLYMLYIALTLLVLLVWKLR